MAAEEHLDVNQVSFVKILTLSMETPCFLTCLRLALDWIGGVGQKLVLCKIRESNSFQELRPHMLS